MEGGGGAALLMKQITGCGDDAGNDWPLETQLSSAAAPHVKLARRGDTNMNKATLMTQAHTHDSGPHT